LADDVDWNAIAAQVMANYEATGSWYVSDATPPVSQPDPAPEPEQPPPAAEQPPPAPEEAPVDWNAIAAQVLANYEATGSWYMGDTTPPVAQPDPVPEPEQPPAPGTPVGAQPGYTVVLSDDFSNGYDHSHWGDPFPLPYPTGPSANGGWMWNPGDVAVRDGEMQVTMTQQADGTWTAGGFNSFRADVGIHYGTVDFDARIESAQGTTAAFLMWPMTDTWPPEIDILETPKGDAMHVLHWGDSSADASIIMGGPDPSEWHHYTLTWLPDLVKIETDGQLVAQWDYNSPDVPMGFGAMGFVGTPWDGWMGGAPDDSTPPVVTAHLDNVVMAQWNGIA
jgi:hypothetical protein